MRTRFAILALLAAAVMPAACASQPANRVSATPMQTVPKVEVARYMGRWYEIARIDMFAQGPDCFNVTADYTLKPGGAVQVINTCRNTEGAITEQVEGSARIVDAVTNAKLKVSFFWPFEGDYWVIALDPDYRWAIVSEPRGRFLWILSRERMPDDARKQEWLALLTAQGFDVSKLVFKQTAAWSGAD